jgi:predicted lipid-binding transport protein (Tim44 family)
MPEKASIEMTDAFDLSTLFFLALAVIIFLRLRSVLGRRTGSERPPFDPYSRRDLPAERDEKTGDAKVISMPGTPRIEDAEGAARDDEDEVAPVWQGHAEAGTPLAGGLEAIASLDRSFRPADFLAGARIAYEEIVKSFAAGDRKGLKGLLSPEVFSSFDGAITDRQQRGETLESSFVGIDKATIVEASTKGRKAMVTVKFVSQLISSTRDSSGEVIEGDPKKVREVVDIWTFMRDAASRDPNWQLVATESAN